jgi:outer membrane lipoprotein-sorting protein
MRLSTICCFAKRLKFKGSKSVLLLAGLAVAGVAPLLTPSGVSACQADSVISLFEKQIGQYQTIRLKYRKEARSLMFGERQPEAGILWLGPPRFYRVENPTQIIVRGTDTLWSYSPGTRQVTLRAGNLDSLEFGPAGFFGSLRQDFLIVDCRPDSADERPAWQVRLAAKTETAPIQRLTLWIDCTTHWAAAADYVDYNEETAHLTFADYRTDHASDRGQFVFAYPRGVERIVLPNTGQPRRPVRDGD